MKAERLESERQRLEWERRRHEEAIHKQRLDQLNALLTDYNKHRTRLSLIQRIERALAERGATDVSAWLAWAKDELRREDPLERIDEYIDLPDWMKRSI